MKKIISFLAAAMVMFSFSVVSHAEDNINVTISDAKVELNASDATVNVKYTFDFPEEVSLLGFQPEVTFDKTALTLNSYTLSGDGVEWGVADSNLNKDYGAYLSFDDANLVGSVATNQYVMTLNFTVNDVKTAASYTVGLKELVGTNSDWGGITDNYGWVVAKEGTITVAAASAPQSFNAKVAYGAKAQAAKGIKFNLTTDDATKNVKTVDYSVPFFAEDADKSGIENIGNIAVGLTINGVPSGVTVTANSAELY